MEQQFDLTFEKWHSVNPSFYYIKEKLKANTNGEYTVKKITRFLDLFWPNLPGTGTGCIILGLGEFGKWNPGWGREYCKTFFYSVCLCSVNGVRSVHYNSWARILCIGCLHKQITCSDILPNPFLPGIHVWYLVAQKRRHSFNLLVVFS